jgi:hypothetical protein
MTAPAGPIDFIGHRYRHRRPPGPGARDSADLLLATFDAAGAGDDGRRIVDAVLGEFGAAATVWGAKATRSGGLGWELYWYDDHPERRSVSYRRGVAALAAAVPFGAPAGLDEALPYVSFSFDVQAEHGRLSVGGATVYVGEAADSGRSVGLSYRVCGPDRLELRNVYQTFDAGRAEELAGLRRAVQRSVHARTGSDWVPPWLDRLPAATVILARKPRHDALYFRRSTLEAAVELDEFGFLPGPLARDLRSAVADWSHLHVDVGIDYRWERVAGRPLRFAFFGYL